MMGLKELVRKHIDQYLEQLDGEIPQIYTTSS